MPGDAQDRQSSKSVRLPAQAHRRLEELSNATGLPQSELLVQAVAALASEPKLKLLAESFTAWQRAKHEALREVRERADSARRKGEQRQDDDG